MQIKMYYCRYAIKVLNVLKLLEVRENIEKNSKKADTVYRFTFILEETLITLRNLLSKNYVVRSRNDEKYFQIMCRKKKLLHIPLL